VGLTLFGERLTLRQAVGVGAAKVLGVVLLLVA